MIKTLTNNQQYRSFLDTRTGDVIIQVYDIDFYGSECYWESIVRADGRVDGGHQLNMSKQEAVNKLLGVDGTTVRDADDYLRRLAKRDKENAKTKEETL